MLLHWDGAATRDSAAAALYELWLFNLQEAVIHRVIAATAAADPSAVAADAVAMEARTSSSVTWSIPIL